MENLLFCANHPGKIAKKHCNRCDLNLCNECIFESHIEHHEEITKIEYLINTKQNKVPEFLSKEIKLIIDKSFNDLKPQIYQLVEKETEQYIKDHKSLQLKVNQSKKGKHISFPIKKENKPNANFYRNIKQSVNVNGHTQVFKGKEILKRTVFRSNTVGASIKERAKMFDLMDITETEKEHDENNPLYKHVDKNKGVRAIAQLFENIK